jgi:uncharacterized protein
MARRTRRRPPARSSGPRVPIGAILAAVVVVGLIVVVIALLRHQMQGYFSGAPPRHHGAVGAPAAVPSAEVTPQASAPVASPLASASVPSGPRVAVIIDDCGYSKTRCKLFLQLPIPITLSILPLTPYAKQTQTDALAAGKAVMLHLPMEPDSTQANPGTGAITTEMSDDAVRTQVEADIDSLDGVPGANNHEGSKATADTRVMRDVLDVLHDRHMFFIDSMTSEQTVGAPLAREIGVPTAERDVFLDNHKDLAYIQGQLAQVVEVARKRGSAIAIGHPNETTAQALAQAIPQMQAAGITFVDAATLVK